MTRRGAILSVGDELVEGARLDRNARWLGAALAARGWHPVQARVVGDDRAQIVRAVSELAEEADVLLITGGLGPTPDDLTRHGLGDALCPGEALVTDPVAAAHLEAFFGRRGRPVPPAALVQARRPRAMSFLDNPFGTAMGLAGRLGGCLVLALPGPPAEMRPMFLRQVVPRLPAAKPLPGTTFACQVHAAGLGESTAAELLGPILDRRRDPQVGITASGGLVTARVRCLGGGAAAGALGETACEIERRWTPFAYGRGRETLARSVGSTLGAQGRTLATAESCTGGLLSSMIVDVAGCSGWFRGGWVTYSNALKTSCLGVPAALLEARGAVSREVSLEMARAALDRSGADISVAVTGIAGPEGGTPQKPLGTVWIGLMGPGGRGVARRFLFPGERPAVRRLAALWALQLLRLELLGVGAGTTLLWEQADEEGPR